MVGLGAVKETSDLIQRQMRHCTGEIEGDVPRLRGVRLLIPSQQRARLQIVGPFDFEPYYFNSAVARRQIMGDVGHADCFIRPRSACKHFWQIFVSVSGSFNADREKSIPPGFVLKDFS